MVSWYLFGDSLTDLDYYYPPLLLFPILLIPLSLLNTAGTLQTVNRVEDHTICFLFFRSCEIKEAMH